MNLKEFFKRDNLDEMQKQTLLKIESRGFWVLWVLLLAALIIESLLGFAPREMAAEFFIFMLGCAYSVLSDLRAGDGLAGHAHHRRQIRLGHIQRSAGGLQLQILCHCLRFLSSCCDFTIARALHYVKYILLFEK